jgi:steroid delta-isomerase-like uncharacterized protein
MAQTIGMRAADQQRVIEEWATLWTAHDMERLLPLFTEDLVYEDVTLGAVNRGPTQLRAFGEGFIAGFPDVTFELTSACADGTRGGAEWIMRGTHDGDLPGMPATGRRVEIRGASAFEFRDDKICRCTDYWDMAMLLKQLGLMPTQRM